MSADPRTEADPSSPTLVERMESVCDRFEDAWRHGDEPRAEDYWQEGSESEGLLRELLVLELAYRRRTGGDAVLDLEACLARFPGHEPTVHAAFEALSTDETPGDLPACDAEFVWQSGSRTGTEFDSPAPFGAKEDPDQEHLIDALSRAGYEVTGELGRGGMGLVYEARQVALGRVVAVKALKSGLFATEDERRRFLNEAAAVARLDHPGIVPVYEVRRSRGLDFFSMKKVEGRSLDRRVKQGPIAPRDAARLVLQAARAVDFAHRHGILHRDIKPANILVDATGAAYLTDFGLARNLEPSATEATETGAVLGTPGFMSPEQVEGKHHSLTTSTDVFGLGAVLYATLTGRAPHVGSSIAETLDQVRTSAPRPPSRLNPKVPRDLEVICLKCLEKDPQRRYGSAGDLADDLARWLEGKPISARPASLLRRTRMWVRRHPVPAALVIALVSVLVVGATGIVWQWRESNRQRLQAERLLDYLANSLIGQASTEANPQGANLTVRELLDRQAARIGGDFQGQPELEAALRETIGNAYHSLGLFERADKELRRAFELSRELHGPNDPVSIRVSTRLGRVLADSGRATEAEGLLSRARDTAHRTLGADNPLTLEATGRLGTVLLTLHRPSQAEPLLRQTLAGRRRALSADHPDTLRSVHDLCRLAMETGRFEEAESLAHEYEYGIRCARGPNHPDNVIALANRGLIRRLRGKLAEAEVYYHKAADEAQRILGPEHPGTLAAQHEHSEIVKELGQRGLPRIQ